jgi:hypothetical protein
MGWTYSLASEALPSPLANGSAQSPTVKTTDMLRAFSCLECQTDTYLELQSGMTCERCGLPISSTASISSTEDSPARISAAQELEQAWKVSAADSSLRSSDLPKRYALLSSSLRTSLQSGQEDLTVFASSWPAWGMICGGLLSQPQRLEPAIFVNDGSYLPTPTACDYGKNVGRKSDGITPSGKDRWSQTVRARRGELPGHPKGSLNPQWIEQAMGYPIGWTAITDWVTPLCRPKRVSRSKG